VWCINCVHIYFTRVRLIVEASTFLYNAALNIPLLRVQPTHLKLHGPIYFTFSHRIMYAFLEQTTKVIYFIWIIPIISIGLRGNHSNFQLNICFCDSARKCLILKYSWSRDVVSAVFFNVDITRNGRQCIDVNFMKDLERNI
jgi:hypothetical protein